MTEEAPNRAARLRAGLAAAGKWLRAFVLKHWLPLCFLVATLIALTAPAPGRAVASVLVSGAATPRYRSCAAALSCSC